MMKIMKKEQNPHDFKNQNTNLMNHMTAKHSIFDFRHFMLQEIKQRGTGNTRRFLCEDNVYNVRLSDLKCHLLDPY
jgi:hypothetical protein